MNDMSQENLPALKTLLTRKVPRYTSYPTANHFKSVEAGVAEGWFSSLPPSKPVSLYLHIPFCREICAYCGCTTKASRKQAPIIEYVARLEKEILVRGMSFSFRPHASMISWGGGTPSLLEEAEFETLMRALGQSFDLSDVKEHAFEIDPRTYSRDKAALLARMGVNRISFGVQDLNEEVQEAIGRIQSFEVLERAVAWTREVGIHTINFDLMYGLPKQDGAALLASLEKCLTLSPNRIALFGYAHMPDLRKNQRLIDEASLPDLETRFSQNSLAAEYLVAQGYEMIGFDHFAKPSDSLSRAQKAGTMKRNFQGYSSDKADYLIGLGASSISTLPAGYVQNIVDTKAYMATIGVGPSPLARGMKISLEDRLRRDVINELLCFFEIDLETLEAPEDIKAGIIHDAKRLEEYEALGLVEVSGNMVKILPAGRPYARLIVSVFDNYLPQIVQNHAVAV